MFAATTWAPRRYATYFSPRHWYTPSAAFATYISLSRVPAVPSKRAPQSWGRIFTPKSARRPRTTTDIAFDATTIYYIHIITQKDISLVNSWLLAQPPRAPYYYADASFSMPAYKRAASFSFFCAPRRRRSMPLCDDMTASHSRHLRHTSEYIRARRRHWFSFPRRRRHFANSRQLECRRLY